MSDAFTFKEQEAILLTTVKNTAQQHRYPPGSKSTNDKVFLLSYAEAQQYLGVNDNASAKPRTVSTAYAMAQGAETVSIIRRTTENWQQHSCFAPTVRITA